MSTPPTSAYTPLADHRFRASELTRGPWDPAHQHAGPPTALVCRAIEHAAAHGLASNGCGVAESRLYDVDGLIGLATQSLSVRPRT